MEPTSLITVPSVQEIAKEPFTKVPERYVRPLHERPILSTTCTPLPQIPVIDLSKLLSQDTKGPELERLHSACKEWGFFQVINHGVSTSLVESVKKGVEKFFNLPMEEKKKFGQRQGDDEGYGQLFVFSKDQKLDWGDMFYLFTLPPEKRKQHLLPNLPLPFRDDLESYSNEMKKLATMILEQMANALTMDTIEMKEAFGVGAQSIRINYYPPCPEPDLVMGLNPHSDAGGLTILLQANEVEGLQIRKDELWIPVKPLPNAFIINIGDVLEMITNGIYRSIEHRATVNSEKERLSVATFYLPSMESIVGPAPSLVTPTKWFEEGVKRQVGNGQNTCLWTEKWAGNAPLKDLFNRLFKLAETKDAKINDVRAWEDGRWKWKWRWRRGLLSREVSMLEEMEAVISNITIIPTMEDRWYWTRGIAGGFSVKSAYATTNQGQNSTQFNADTKLIWSNYVPPKVSSFVWKVCLNGIPTKTNLLTRGIRFREAELLCPFCNQHKETTQHLLFTCSVSYQMWLKLYDHFSVIVTLPNSAINHICQHSGLWQHSTSKKAWMIVWFGVVWKLWLWRNTLIFKQTANPPNFDGIFEEILFTIWTWLKAFVNRFPYSYSAWRVNSMDCLKSCVKQKQHA